MIGLVGNPGVQKEGLSQQRMETVLKLVWKDLKTERPTGLQVRREVLHAENEHGTNFVWLADKRNLYRRVVEPLTSVAPAQVK